jgi:hypothetical protein
MRRFALLVLFFLPLSLRAQDANFRTTYSGALIVTPVNTNFQFTPDQDLQPILSGSIEYSFHKTDRLGFEFSGGFYPYGDRMEEVLHFGIRRFFAHAAPIGGYWEMMTVGGVTQNPEMTNTAEPLFGIGLRLGSLRTTLFGDFAFEYGGGPTLVLTGGQTQLRAEFFFGLGWMLGKDIVIER